MLDATAALRLLANAKAYFYASTTTTPQDTFTTSALDVAHDNPVVADSSGTWPTIYLDPTLLYKVQIKTTAGALIYEQDPVNDSVLSQSVIAGYLFPQTAEENADSVTPSFLQYQYGDSRRRGSSVSLTAELVGEFFDFGHTATRVSNTTFTVSGDRTADYPFGSRIRLIDNAGGITYWRAQSVSYSAPDTTIIAQADAGNVPTTIRSIAVDMRSRQSGPPTFAWSGLINDGMFFWCTNDTANAISRIAIAVGQTSGAGAHGADNALAIVATHPDRVTPYLTGGMAGAGIYYHTGIDVDLFFGVQDTVRLHIQAATEPITMQGSEEALRLLSPRADDTGGVHLTFYEDDGTTRKGRIGFDDGGTSNRLAIVNEESGATTVIISSGKIAFTNPQKAFVFDLLDAYADDAAAAIGGVEVGELYRTGSAVKQRVA